MKLHVRADKAEMRTRMVQNSVGNGLFFLYLQTAGA